MREAGHPDRLSAGAAPCPLNLTPKLRHPSGFWGTSSPPSLWDPLQLLYWTPWAKEPWSQTVCGGGSIAARLRAKETELSEVGVIQPRPALGCGHSCREALGRSALTFFS